MTNEYERTKRIILQSVSSLDVAQQEGLPVNKYGRMDVCPICHHVGHGGFVANPKEGDRRGGYYCHYQHHGGNVIDFVMNLRGFEYTEAVNYIIRMFNLNVPEISGLSDAEQARATRDQKTRNAFLVLYEHGVELFHKVMRDGQTEHVRECNTYLDDIIDMINKIN